MSELGFWNFAQRDPDKLALVDPDEREWSRGELFAESNKIAHGLRALGLEQGDCVALVMENCAEFFQIHLAITQLGMYMTPINNHLTGPEIAFIVQDSGAKVFFGSDHFADACRAAREELDFPSDHAFSLGSVEGFRPLEEIKAGQPGTLPEDRFAGQVMNYTSGTTGKPKGVRRALAPISPDLVATLTTAFLGMFGLQPEDDNVHICGSPLYHTAVLVFSSSSLHLGHTVVLMEKWLPEEMLRLIDKYQVTQSHMVPTQFHRLLKLDESVRSKYDVSSLRAMIHAAAPCPVETKWKMLDWWGESIYEYYAATEGGGTLVTPEEWKKFPGTVGKAWANADIKIYDDQENELGPGQVGTVYMLLGQADFEYKDAKQKTKDNRIGSYFTVGDIGELNDEGYLFLRDRKTDMIISGGANIYPAEIEAELIQHPKIADVAVFGIPNDDWGEEIKAVVQTIDGVEANDALVDAIFEWCKDRLAKMKTPRSIDFVDELPRDPNGKLYKRKLRDPYWEGRSQI
ncbi:MAG: acyl-CoA synthetase [Deltaproteobacteria bacterium]|nr:acyl-CoA synthetase [Deltaproteobacteria bacterium]